MTFDKPEVEFGNEFWISLKMKLIFFALLLLFPVQAFSDELVRHRLGLIRELAESRLELSEIILRNSADFWSENPDVSTRKGHVALKGILNENKHFRSILAIDENGDLAFDSYNGWPISFVGSLAERDYFTRTRSDAPKVLRINLPIIGKQSGLPFIPISMVVPWGSEGNRRMVVISMPPEALLPETEYCPFCGVIVLQGRNVLASSNPLSSVNEALVGRLEFDGLYGAKELEVRGMAVSVHWQKSKKNDLTFVYYEAQPV